MNRPKFAPGDRVKRPRLGTGKVLSCINLNAPEDVKIQGYRYEALFNGQIWSIPESALLESKPSPKEFN